VIFETEVFLPLLTSLQNEIGFDGGGAILPGQY